MPFTYGAIRLLNGHILHERHTLTVVAGSSNPAEGTINIGRPESLSDKREACWVGEPPPGQSASLEGDSELDVWTFSPAMIASRHVWRT
jgi:hypothetical protein